MFSSHNIITGLFIVALLGGAYYFFFLSGSPTVPLSATSAPPVSAQFIQLANQLTSITLDTNIFSDPRFGELVDLATPVTPENIGRVDPFAPLGK